MEYEEYFDVQDIGSQEIPRRFALSTRAWNRKLSRTIQKNTLPKKVHVLSEKKHYEQELM